ncbi:MAG: AraC family transcriptional regulator ligand-binding domain-containing protein [Burkholderiaceae bacterium]|nr:AraC family transcriptional regulator ligand-binding domain-containing protein [Burkholderiaceae bacterium]
MQVIEPTLPSRYVLPIIDWAESEQPGSRDLLLAACDLTHQAFSEAQVSLTVTQFDRLIETCEHELGRTDIGFELGLRLGIDQHGALSTVLRNCTTLDELLRTSERYFRLITPIIVGRYTRHAEFGEYRTSVAAPMTRRTLHQTLELQAVSIQRDVQQMLGGEARFDTYLSMPRPTHHARYRQLQPGRFHFDAVGSPEVRSVFSADVLDRPLVLKNTVPLQTSRSALDETLAKLMPSQHYGNWVEMMLREALAVQPSLQDLAEVLGMSARTLTRKLANEGQDFRKLAKWVRFERACDLLRMSRQPVMQIAHSLGYTSTAAFIYAFRSEGGMTPGKFRQQHVSGNFE